MTNGRLIPHLAKLRERAPYLLNILGREMTEDWGWTPAG